jgi:5-formyltetrahydrofolate cyclo-ligase
LTGFGVAAEKEVLRRRYLELRDELTPQTVERKSREIVETVLGLPEYVGAQVVASYIAKNNEVQTQVLIKKALGAGKKVLVPVTQRKSRELLFSEIPSLYAVSTSTFGILEPKPADRKLRHITTADVVIVPGIVWDAAGHRLGWGRGYFDGALAKVRKDALSVGLAFDLQLVEKVPREQFDLPVKMIVTESGVIRCHE